MENIERIVTHIRDSSRDGKCEKNSELLLSLIDFRKEVFLVPNRKILKIR